MHTEDATKWRNLRVQMLRILDEILAPAPAVVHGTSMAVTEAGHAASNALDSLYRRHGAEVYRYALAVLGNHSDAEDVTQTTFLNAYRALEQGVHPRKPANWLLTIASNAIKQRFRQEQARPREVELDRELPVDGNDDDDGPTVGELLAALSKIPPQQRQAIVLREFEGRSYKEIAEILSVTTSALETLLFRARRSLSDELAHQLTCTEAQLAISRAADGRLGRKEKRRLSEHINECPDCAQFSRLQQRHRSAFRGLALVPIPFSLTLFKGLEGSASAATLHVAAGTAATGTSAAGVGGGTGGTAAGGGTVLAGSGGAFAGGGGLFAGGGGVLAAGGVAAKAAAVVAAATVAGGVTVAGVKEIGHHPGKNKKTSPAQTTSESKNGVVHSQRASHASANGLLHGKAIARGQTGNLPPALAHGQTDHGNQAAASHGGQPTHGAAANTGGSAQHEQNAPVKAGHAKSTASDSEPATSPDRSTGQPSDTGNGHAKNPNASKDPAATKDPHATQDPAVTTTPSDTTDPAATEPAAGNGPKDTTGQGQGQGQGQGNPNSP